ncbi:MAG: S-layer homology domain-containing protein, partial [Clostridia bacterium]|nr:S-layer homology domain-containing protein [Clostridia bacterium]
ELYGEPTWKIVVFHHSIYSAAVDRIEEGADRRERFADLMSEMDIDVVLMGHDHIYTRTYMMAGGLTPIDDASRYVQVGNDPYGSYYDPAEGEVFFLTVNTAASSKFYTMTDGKEPYAAYKNQESISNITKIDVTEDCIQFSTYRSMENNDIGDRLDFFAIHKTKDAGEDTHAPVLNVPDEAFYFTSSDSIKYGYEIVNFWPQITAYDNRDGDISDNVMLLPGCSVYTDGNMTYDVRDKAGNTTTKKVNITHLNDQEVISSDTEWKYLDEGNYPFEMGGDQTAWLADDYDDGQWKTGIGAFGSIDDQLADHNGVTPDTLLPVYFPEGSDEEGALIPNFFFRTTFDLKDPENIDILIGDLWYDDAALIYINGVLVKEIFQNSEFVTGYSTVDRDGPSTYGSFRITDPELIASLNLKEKGNVLAVELFQGHLESNDIFFNFESLIAASIIDSIEPPFSDVWVSHWYYEYVARAYAMGLFAGVTETTFEPKTAMTRAMVWTVLAKMSGIETAGGEKWYSNAQKWANENGVSDGSSPKNNISRQEIVTMLYSLSGRPEVTGNLDSYTDNGSVSSWAFDALVWATEKGVMTGRGEGILDPRTALTRAEACTVILAYIDIE